MEDSNNETQKNNSLIKVILIILGLFLAGAGAYIYKQTVDLKLVRIENANLDKEKTASLNKLKELEVTYENALANNSSITSELNAEKEKVLQLKAEIEKAKPNLIQLQNYKNRIAVFENKMNDLMNQVNNLKQENTILKMQRDSSMYVLKEYEKSNKIFYNKSGEVDKEKIKTATNAGVDSGLIKTRTATEKLWAIKISDLNVKTFDSASNKDNPVESKNAAKIDLVKISFNLPTNFVIRASQRPYFIQILSDKGILMGENAIVTFDDKSTLNYSFKITAPYKNKKIGIIENLYCKNFKKGTYFVNVFDSNVLNDKTSFILN
jgi:hypothetical protein